jgi:hypothetical protein
MPNPIKYNTSAETLALKKGNFWIGTGDVSKGPTSSTGFYNGITPPSGGYTIYLNKASGGPSIYAASNDAQLISLTNSIAGASYTTVNQCLVYYAGQTDKMCVNRDYESIVTDGLIVNLDAGFTPSYPRNGTTWYDISGNENNFTIYNSTSFSSDNSGLLIFDGVDDYCRSTNPINLSSYSAVTVQVIPYSVENNVGMIYESSNDWNGNAGGFGLNVNSNGYGYSLNLSHFYWNTNGGTNTGARNFISNTSNNFTVLTKVLIKNNSDGLQDYVNGSRVSYEISPWGTGTSTIGNTTNFRNDHIFIGSRGGTGSWFQGKISNFLVYNRALSPSEIIQNYNAQKGRFGL